MTETVKDRIIDLLGRTGTASSADQVPPVAVLWPDPERQFEAILPRLRERLPLVSIGRYDPDAASGPGIWVRIAVSSGRESNGDEESGPPIVYLGGFTREDIRDVAGGPADLQAIADLQFRGVTLLQRNGREWTVAGLLASEHGLDLEVARDRATREALLRAFPRLLDEPLADLRRRGLLDAEFFNELLNPDEQASLLFWLNDPAGMQATADRARWEAFLQIARTKYGFDPEVDGSVTGARRLGERQGAWGQVWARYVEAPERFPGIPDRLRAAHPVETVPLPQDSWPRTNDDEEAALEGELAKFESFNSAEAKARVRQLEKRHGPRRGWVWSRLGHAPLGQALAHLVDLADRCDEPLGGETVDVIAKGFVDSAWRTDRAAMSALAAVEPGPAAEAVGRAVAALYRDWLDEAARAFQERWIDERPKPSVDSYEPGTAVMFVDGFRYDAAQRVADEFGDGFSVDLQWRLAAAPTVTPTAKPAVSPLASALFPGPDFDPSPTEGGPRLSSSSFRKAMEDQGWQILGEGGWGDPAGRGWLEGADIDKQGHNIPAKLPHRLESEARQIAEQIKDLLSFGWERVVVVTDHGWVYLPGGLPKVELPIHAAVKRKGRCARIPEEVSIDFPTVPWRWDPKVRIAVAPGITCFEAGKVYEHGGISPQESVTPHLVVTQAAKTVSQGPATITGVRWKRLRVYVQATGAEGLHADVRTKPADPSSSVVDEPRGIEGGECSLLISDHDREGDAVSVVIVGQDGTVAAQQLTTVGG